jgi:hypothetical protein
MGDLPQNHREVDILFYVISEELANILFLHIPKHKIRYHESKTDLPETLRSSFPKASYEFVRASNCFSLSEHTACVFHSMRVLEHGLKALAHDVGRIFDIQQWHNIIEEIKYEIDTIAKSLPRGQAKNERLQFLSAAAKEFTYFKDGWRNYVAHGHMSYTEIQALNILDHVRIFMIHISEQLKEV